MKTVKKKPVAKPSGRRRMTGGAAVAAMVPLALATILPAALNRGTAVKPKPKAQSVRTFHIAFGNLKDFASKVVTTISDVKITGASGVHALTKDCEIHFGASSPNFSGRPSGLVLEPMNACTEALPGNTEAKKSDWLAFADKLEDGPPVIASGIPRIWPEHLEGGGPSNPDHAVELHPVTGMVVDNKNMDFAPLVFAPAEFEGIKPETAEAIVQTTSISVVRNGNSTQINFSSSRIGNFAVIEVVIDRESIENDGDGSFRMDGEVAVEDGTAFPVRIVTAKGSPINDQIQTLRNQRGREFTLEALVLFSLSPEALLDAAKKSNGNEVMVDRPIQLILYGEPGAQEEAANQKSAAPAATPTATPTATPRRPAVTGRALLFPEPSSWFYSQTDYRAPRIATAC